MKHITLSQKARLIAVITVLIILYFVSFIPIYTVALRLIPNLHSFGAIFFNMTALVLSIILFFIFNKLYRYFQYPPIMLIPKSPIDSTQKLLIQGLLFSLLSIFIVGLCEQLIFGETYNNKLFLLIFGVPIYYWGSNIFPAVTEEILFRGGFIHAFRAIGKSRLGVFVSGIIFGLAHMLNLIRESIGTQEIFWLINLVLAGILLGYIYLRFGLIIVIFFHWFWNTSWADNMVQIERSPVSTAMFIVSIILFEVFEYRNKQRHDGIFKNQDAFL